jgi:flagellar protein FlaJ
MMTSGGNLALYLKEKSEEYMNDYRRRIRKYSQDLSLYVEMYLTLIITGSIFFIVLSSIISSISAGLGTIVLQSLIVFILLPLISIGFIFLIRSANPT